MKELCADIKTKDAFLQEASMQILSSAECETGGQSTERCGGQKQRGKNLTYVCRMIEDINCLEIQLSMHITTSGKYK